jgi:putative acetyltransferase
MIILIGGVGYAGKTYMAQNLLEKYKMPYLSIDHLKMGIYRSDENCGFTPLNSLEHIGEKLWGILKGIIMTNIENKQNLIIEGAYLLPEKIKELQCDEEYAPYIISFYMGFSEEYIKKYFESKVLKYDSVIEERDEPDDKDTATLYILENAKMKKTCENGGAKYFEIDGEYKEEIKKVYDWIDEQIKNNK